MFKDLSTEIGDIVRRHWSILSNGLEIIPAFRNPPIMSYKRAMNLKDKLVKSEVGILARSTQNFFGRPSLGSYPCLGCVNCKLMHKGSQFVHPLTKVTFDIRYYLTCGSDWVIYALWCPCKLVYIGETKWAMRTRLNNYRYSIRKGRLDLTLSKHFIESKHNEWDLKFMILDHVPRPRGGGNRLMLLKKKELMCWFSLFAMVLFDIAATAQ